MYSPSVEKMRAFLYFPLGLLPSLFFTLRMLIQWIQSERRKESCVTPLFWKLSLAGNLLLYCHHVVQVQLHFALFQCVNALIAWRNLDFLQKERAPRSRGVVFGLLGGALLLTVLFFLWQGIFLLDEMDWVRTPQKLWNVTRQYHSTAWHIMGTFGAALFASRLWIQWWGAESQQQSTLGRAYWILSIVGSAIVLLYAWHIRDVVIAIYHLFALIPYLRNLMLIKRRS